MRYRFTHIYPEIFAHLTHGVDAVVHRATEGSHYSDPVVSAEGSTVVLEPGDELETTAPQDHPHLEPADQAAQDAATVPLEPSEGTGSGTVEADPDSPIPGTVETTESIGEGTQDGPPDVPPVSSDPTQTGE